MSHHAKDALMRLGDRGIIKNLPSWAEFTWKSCSSRLAELRSSASDLPEYTRAIDTISEDACAVLDTCSCLMSVHAAEDVRQTATRVFLNLYSKVQEINLDSSIYYGLAKAYNRRYGAISSDNHSLPFGESAIASTRSARMPLRENQSDFVFGQAAPGERRRLLNFSTVPNDWSTGEKELERVSRRLLEEFEWEGAGITDQRRRSHIHHLQDTVRSLQSRAMDEEANLSMQRPPFVLRNVRYEKTNQNFLQLASSGNENTQEVYEQYYASDPVLDRLGRTRQELRRTRYDLSQALGFKSYAHFATNKNMAKTPETVRSFLESLVGELAPRVQSVVGPNVSYSDVPRIAASLSNNRQISHRVNSIFVVDKCLDALKQIAEKLFGLTVIESTVSASNSWSLDDSCREWTFVDELGSTRGSLLLDLFQRPGKNPSPALFQLRSKLNRGGKTPSLVLLSCAFPVRAKSSSSSIGHFGFRTLMHEFGHALHGILSETEFQHLAGTRCEMDFSETPSLLLERMAWHPSVLRLLDPFETVSNVELSGLEKTRASGVASLEAYEQAILGMVDLDLHLGDPSQKDENTIYWDVHRRLSCINTPRHPDRVRSEVFFNHTISDYGGSFYAYSWSNAIAEQIWSKLFGENPFEAGAGLEFRKGLLETGGSRDPQAVLGSLVGTLQVDPTHWVRSTSV